MANKHVKGSHHQSLKKYKSKSQGVATYNTLEDFPGGPVVKNLPANARDMESVTGRGTKIPHAMGQRRPCTGTAEAHVPQSLNTTKREACGGMKTQHNQKKEPKQTKPPKPMGCEVKKTGI